MYLLNPLSIGRQMRSLMASLNKGSRRRSLRRSFSMAPAMVEVLEPRILMTHGNDINDQISEAVHVQISESVSQGIDPVTDVDMYEFQKPANVDVVISLESDTAGFSPLLRVFQQEAGGSIVQINNPSVDPGDYELPLSAGTYWIGVSESANAYYSPVSGSGDLVSPSSRTGYYTLNVSATQPVGGVDLNVVVVYGISTQSAGENTIIDAGVWNDGTIASDPYPVAFYLSTDSTITRSDRLLKTMTRPGLAAGELDTISEFVLIPADVAPGVYHVGIIVDPLNLIAELSESNNAMAADSTMTIGSADSDLDDQLSQAMALGSMTQTRTRTGESISVDTDVDMYSFSVTAGQQITFDTDGELDSVIELFDSNGTFLDGNDQGAAPDEIESDESFLDYTFTSGGTFYLGVSGFQNEDYDPITGDGDNAGATGAYSLILTPVGGDSDPDDQLSQAMALGSMTQTRTRTGESISVDTDVDMYSFSVTAGQRITFDIDGDLDSIIELFDNNGTFLDGNDQGAAPDETAGDESFLDYTFTSGGTFYLGVSGFQNEDYDPITGDDDNAGATGAYSLILTPVSGQVNGDPDDQLSEAMALGSMTQTRTQTGESIATGADVDMYSFSVTAGQRITFDTDGVLNSYIRLFNGSGTELASNDQGAAPNESNSNESFLDHTFTGAGTFYLGVSGWLNTSYDPINGSGDQNAYMGAYSLTLTPVTVDADPDDQISQAIALGSMTQTRTRTGEKISVGTDVDMYSFTVAAGQRITFDIDGGFDSFIRLFNRNGGELARNDEGEAPEESGSSESYLDYTFTSGGTFFLGVSSWPNLAYDAVTGDGDNTGVATGAYSLTLTPVTRPMTTLSVASTDANKAEGNSGTTPFTFTVTRSGDTSGVTTVDYSVTGGIVCMAIGCPTTISVTDFFGGAVPSGTVSFAAGETTKLITIDVNGDTDSENDERFLLTLSNPTDGATITNFGDGNIQDDDGPVTFIRHNTAPVLDNSGTPYLIAPVGSRLPVDMSNGTLISDLLARGAGGNPITDFDSSHNLRYVGVGEFYGIALTGINKIDGSHGRWEYTLVSNPQASDWIDVETAGAISNTSALLLPANARLRFVTALIPYHGSSASAGHLPTETKLDTGLTFRAWDRTTGTEGERADTSINGGSTAFSTATETVGTYFETRLWRTYNATAQLNTYSLELEATILINQFGYQDRSTSDYSGFTILMSPIPGVSTAPLYRMYFGTSYSTDGITQTDMGYRYLTTNLNEAITLEGYGPAAHRAERDGTYFRELGVNNGSGITGYVYTTAQPGTTEMSQIYRTDLFNKNTRTGAPGSPVTGTVRQQQGDHVYTTKTAFEMSKLGTWRQESSRGFVRELSRNVGGIAAAARSASAQAFPGADQKSASTAPASFAEFPRNQVGLLAQPEIPLPLTSATTVRIADSADVMGLSESTNSEQCEPLTMQNDAEQSLPSEEVWSAFGRRFSDFFASCP